MANQIVIALPRVTDANGDAVSGAKAYFYQKGTTTPVTVYSDEALSVPHASPLVADSGGVFAQVFHDGATEVKAVVQDADDAALYTLDPAPLSTGVASAAENVTVAPFTGVVATNVQAALEEVQSNITAVGANVQTPVQTGGSANAYTLNAADTITAYAAGQRFLIRPNHTNTGAATLNVDSLGAKDIKVYNTAGSLVDPAAGDISANRLCEVTYDGTRFVLFPGMSADMLVDSQSLTKAATVKAVQDAGPSAWLVMNGTGTPAVIASYNFSATIVDNGTGNYSVTFATAMANANYAVVTGGGSAQRRITSPTTTGFNIINEDDTGTNEDNALISVAVFGGLS